LVKMTDGARKEAKNRLVVKLYTAAATTLRGLRESLIYVVMNSSGPICTCLTVDKKA
jgi:hypothetical protein